MMGLDAISRCLKISSIQCLKVLPNTNFKSSSTQMCPQYKYDNKCKYKNPQKCNFPPTKTQFLKCALDIYQMSSAPPLSNVQGGIENSQCKGCVGMQERISSSPNCSTSLVTSSDFQKHSGHHSPTLFHSGSHFRILIAPPPPQHLAHRPCFNI